MFGGGAAGSTLVRHRRGLSDLLPAERMSCANVDSIPEADTRLQTMATLVVSLATESTVEKVQWHRRHTVILGNPFGLTKQLLGQKHSGHLACSKEEMDHHLPNTYSDAAQEDHLGE